MTILLAGCGAFIHGMEDEFRAVRSNTVQAMCDLSTSCPEYGAVSMSHLVDMLNDETGGVRLLAIRSLQLISEVGSLIAGDDLHKYFESSWLIHISYRLNFLNSPSRLPHTIILECYIIYCLTYNFLCLHAD